MSGFQGSISSTNPPGAPQGFINIAGADDGLSVSPGQFIQLGQLAGTGAAGPARLLDSREIPMGGNSLSIGVGADTQNFSVLQVNAELSLWQDVTQSFTGMVILPPNNLSTTGLPGLGESFINVTQQLNFTNPASFGFVTDFGSSATWNPSAGATNYVSYNANPTCTPSGGTGNIVSFANSVQLNAGAGATGTFRGFFHGPNIVSLGGMKHVAFENAFGNNQFNSDGAGDPGLTGFGLAGALPTAMAHIGPSLGTAGHGPLKLSSGPLLAVAEAGLFEFNGTNLFFTPAATRQSVLLGNSGAAAPATSPGIALLTFYGTGGAIYLSTPNSWASVVIGGTAFKIPLYT